jgi:hypothetical protein
MFQLMSKVVQFENELFVCAQLSVRVLSGARQINFGRWVLIRVNGGILILVNCRGVAKARRVVESHLHHHMRGLGDP